MIISFVRQWTEFQSVFYSLYHTRKKIHRRFCKHFLPHRSKYRRFHSALLHCRPTGTVSATASALQGHHKQGRSPEPKELRIDLTATVTVRTKILRLHCATLHCAQDGKTGGVVCKMEFDKLKACTAPLGSSSSNGTNGRLNGSDLSPLLPGAFNPSAPGRWLPALLHPEHRKRLWVCLASCF